VRRIIVLSVTAFLLASCSPEAPGGGDALPPADAPSPAPAPAEQPPAEAQPIAFSARGTEPFWRVDITNEKITLTRPDAPAQTVTGVTAAVVSGQAVNLASVGPPAVQAAFTLEACSDGMSDLTYPYKVEVRWGAEVLKGCGFLTAKEPREGQ